MNKLSAYVPQHYGRLPRYKDVPNLPQGLWEIKGAGQPTHTIKAVRGRLSGNGT